MVIIVKPGETMPELYYRLRSEELRQHDLLRDAGGRWKEPIKHIIHIPVHLFREFLGSLNKYQLQELAENGTLMRNHVRFIHGSSTESIQQPEGSAVKK